MRVTLADQPGITPKESRELGSALSESLIATLEKLTPEQWRGTTRCDPWTPKDIAAHVLGWGEALVSPREFVAQAKQALSRMKEFGNITDAQNNVQVEERRDLSAKVIIDKLRPTLRKEGIVRQRFGTALRYLPFYMPYLGGPINLGYVLNTIFLRDLLIHRLDICDAIGREPDISETDLRVMTDMVKDWARRTKADVQIDDGANVFVAGAGIDTIRAPLHHVIDVLGGRRDAASLEIDGDRDRVEAWLGKGVPI